MLLALLEYKDVLHLADVGHLTKPLQNSEHIAKVNKVKITISLATNSNKYFKIKNENIKNCIAAFDKYI